MKKSIVFIMCFMALVSCSTKNSKILQIDEVQVKRSYESQSDKICEICSEICSVVPGAYEMTWEKFDESYVPPLYYVTINIKLRLNQKLHVKRSDFRPSFIFHLINAEGNQCPKGQGAILQIVKSPKEMGNSDALEEMRQKMISFLTSEPGTEEEFLIFGAVGPNDDDWLIDVINNAAGIYLEPWLIDLGGIEIIK